MTHIVKRTLAMLTVAAMLLMSGCTNLDDVGKPPAAATTATTMPTTTTTTQAAITPPTTTTTAPTTGDVTPPDEQRSPGVTYFVPKGSAVPASFFDDAVFVGDSVSVKLTAYNLKTKALGNATFLTSGSLSNINALWPLSDPNNVHPTYQGEKVLVEDGVQRCGKQKLYYMLGVNDVGYYGVDAAFEAFKTHLDRILAKSPDITVYIQSVTPILDDYYDVTNERINEFNVLISEYCREKGWYFVDVASVLRDDSGHLKAEYCSDPDAMGIHFTEAACEIWADYLACHTAE